LETTVIRYLSAALTVAVLLVLGGVILVIEWLLGVCERLLWLFLSGTGNLLLALVMLVELVVLEVLGMLFL
jgi:hypothetical protein